MTDINLGAIAILLLFIGSICSYGIGRSMGREAEKKAEIEKNAAKNEE